MTKIILFCILIGLTLQQLPCPVDLQSYEGGQYVVTPNLFPVYTNAGDNTGTLSGSSPTYTCNPTCALTFIPLVLAANYDVNSCANVGIDNVSTTTRADLTGSPSQVTFNGFLLYTFAADKVVENVGGQDYSFASTTWYVISDAGAQITSPTTISPILDTLHRDESSSSFPTFLDPDSHHHHERHSHHHDD